MWKGVSGMVRNPLIAVEVENGFWMLLHMDYGMLLRDFGWFPSRHAAEGKARELAQLLGSVRRAVIHGGYDAAPLN
jgi:hypothetical protein